MQRIRQGNANSDGKLTRQWIVGSFMPEDDIRNTEAVEIKWGNHLADDRRKEWVVGEKRTTIALLIKGRFMIEFPEETVELNRQGDYVMWGPGTDHRWRALDDSVIQTIRWR